MFSKILSVRWSVLACVALALAFSGCRSVPITGRHQLLLTSSGYENELGLTSYQESARTNPQTTNAKQQEVLNRIGKSIANVAPENDFEWEFRVLQSKEVNAFCLPGGKVAVYTGIMPKFKNEAEMACVVAHEIGHALARHGGERISWGYVNTACTLGISAFFGDTAADVFGIGSQYGVMLPFSRSHENEADLIGLYLMSKAGYDPHCAVDFWQRFGTGNDFDFTSTHPSDAKRVANLKAHQEEALQYYNQAPAKKGLGVPFINGVPQK